jgi:hypothetical protein
VVAIMLALLGTVPAIGWVHMTLGPIAAVSDVL